MIRIIEYKAPSQSCRPRPLLGVGSFIRPSKHRRFAGSSMSNSPERRWEEMHRVKCISVDCTAVVQIMGKGQKTMLEEGKCCYRLKEQNEVVT